MLARPHAIAALALLFGGPALATELTATRDARDRNDGTSVDALRTTARLDETGRQDDAYEADRLVERAVREHLRGRDEAAEPLFAKAVELDPTSERKRQGLRGALLAKPYLVGEKKYGFPRFAQLKNKAIVADSIMWKQWVQQRHKKGINVLYADGSGKWVALSAFDKPLWNTVGGMLSGNQSDSDIFLDEDPSDGTPKPRGVWVELDNAK